MTDHALYLQQRRFGSLDGLRALSIIAVIWHHTQPQWARESRFAYIGSEGVTLFFAISGFLITTLLLRERRRTGKVDLRAFYVRRSLRIFPLYYSVLIIYVFAVLLMERDSAAGREFFRNLPYFVTYTSNFFVELKEHVIFYFSWSLAAEEQFYLLWPPLLGMAMVARRAAWPLFIVLTGCVTAQLMGSSFLGKVPVAIVSGALLAVTLDSPTGYRAMTLALRYRIMPLAILVALALVLSLKSIPEFVSHMLFAALVGSCVISEQHVLSKVLGCRPVAFVGMISYGMYLFHMLCKNAAVLVLPGIGLQSGGLGLFPVTLGITAIVAAVSFRYYESIFMNVKKAYVR